MRDALPMLRHLIAIDDGSGTDTSSIGSVAYEDALASGSPDRDFGERSDDDIYILYTGGTTGMPKGVVWRQEDVLCVLGGLVNFDTGIRVLDEWEFAEDRGRGARRRRLRGRHRAAHARRRAVGDHQRPASTGVRPCSRRSSTRTTCGARSRSTRSRRSASPATPWAARSSRRSTRAATTRRRSSRSRRPPPSSARRSRRSSTSASRTSSSPTRSARPRPVTTACG